MRDEELTNSGFNPGIRAIILVTVILGLAMALSPGIRTQQVETQSWMGTHSRHVGFSPLKSKLSSGVIGHHSSPQVQKIGVSVSRTPLEAMSPLLHIFRSRRQLPEHSANSDNSKKR